MGSSIGKEISENKSGKKKIGLGDLAEGCVAMVLMNLEAKDICKLSILNKSFYNASSADFVWESKLPINYLQIIHKLSPKNNKYKYNDGVDKKDIYASLCQFNSIDNGTKKVWLDKVTGGMCVAISAKGLSITGIDDRRYWNHIPTDESRFSTVAYLQQIWWFEINGEVEFPFPDGTYSVFFRVHLGRAFKRFGRRLCNTEQVHGWDMKPVHFQMSTSDGQPTVSQCFLEEPGEWLHYHGGDFVVENSKGPTRVKFSMTQIDCTHTKGGLCLDSVVIYPSSLKERLKRF